MGARMRAMDWSATPIGPVESWSPALRMMVPFLLANRFPQVLWWGPRYVQFYNDPYRAIPGTKHPGALGQLASECWPEIWHIIGPLIDTPFRGGPATWDDDILLEVNRHGFVEETHFTIAYSPVPDETAPGGIGGVLATVHEITEKVVGERRIVALRDLGARAGEAKTAEEACAIAAKTLASHDKDVPFVLLYVLEAAGTRARLGGAAGVEMATAFSPLVSDLRESPDRGWPLAEVIRSETLHVVTRLGERFAVVPPGPWSDPPAQAVVVPIPSNKPHEPVGLMVAGVSARLRLDEYYRDFFELVRNQIATAIANARAYEEERKRAEALAELDRAKTQFFSNVSHEFRTPLTLMLGPIEDLLHKSKPGSTDHNQLEVAHRNSIRLLKLVNTLLDFSRIEAGRIRATYEPVPLAEFTAEVASVFRSTVERAGLQFVVDCPPTADVVYVDREMWEKIVLNLLSNAFKFTFEGRIEVSLQRVGDAIELTVTDTGTGIPADEIPHVFERFHRVPQARSRTFEGSGIGLALVQELARLHGGAVTVESEVGRGSRFAVRIPLGTAHLPADRIAAVSSLASTAVHGEAFVQEALRWLPEGANEPFASANSPGTAETETLKQTPGQTRPRILVADDNADMRDYVKRLLGPPYEVEAVGDGASALAAARARPPDLAVIDVMMPGLDGFELLREWRADAALKAVPVLILSARAGEEARVEGLQAGADDYLVKPFSARELTARVNARLEIARLRGDATRVMSHMAEGLYTVDSQGCVTAMNPAAEALFGWTLDELRGRRMHDVTHYQHQDGSPFAAEECAGLQVLREGITLTDYEDVFIRKDGTFFDVIYSSSPIREGDRIVGLVVVFRDVSERKRTERILMEQSAALRESEAQLRRVSEIKDEFLATLSHELRTPLSAMLGWTQMLRSRSLRADAVEKALESIERNARAQAELVNDLLDVSRIVSGKLYIEKEIVDLTSIVASAVETVAPTAAARRIALRVSSDPHTELVVTGDATRLRQIVWNVLSNGVKFTPPDGTVEVELRRVDSLAQIVVRDTGQGIPPEFLPFVFDRFRQADATTTRRYGGLGLGLAIVRHLTEAHGGTVSAESDGENRGSTFTVRLPLRETPAVRRPAPALAEVQTLQILPAGTRILVVDDQADARELVREVLESAGARVTMATSARDALDKLGRDRFDALLADIGMPEQDGHSLIEMVRRAAGANRNVPAVAVTAYAGVRERDRALTSGFDRHISKPIEPHLLIQAVRQVLRSDP
jgi:PAS domain S-box-containing protein